MGGEYVNEYYKLNDDISGSKNRVDTPTEMSSRIMALEQNSKVPGHF
jgi:hypothetical protein